MAQKYVCVQNKGNWMIFVLGVEALKEAISSDS
jgi:hypothetical protein